MKCGIFINGILFSDKKELNTICFNIDKSKKYVKEKKADTRANILNCSTYIKCSEEEPRERESRSWLTGARGGNKDSM